MYYINIGVKVIDFYKSGLNDLYGQFATGQIEIKGIKDI